MPFILEKRRQHVNKLLLADDFVAVKIETAKEVLVDNRVVQRDLDLKR
jgi:hypothetical protein